MNKVFAHIPQYSFWVVGFLGWPKDKAKKNIKKNWNVENVLGDSNGSCALLQKGNSYISIIYIDKWSNSFRCHALLMHEVIHSCLQLYDKIGQGVCTKDHEHLTYMAQHIFQTLLEKRKQFGSFKKNK